MDLIICPHCRTRVLPSSDGECPSCRKSVDAPVEAFEQDEAARTAEGSDPGTGMVTVARFTDPVEATMAKNCLEEAGFEVFLADAETVSVAWQLSNALGGIKLQVPELEADQARTVLQEQLVGSAGDREELTREATATTPPPGEGGEEDQLEDDGSDEPETEPTGREQDAERAFRGAVFGLIFIPLQFYASYLLLRVLFSTEILAGRPRKRACIAAAINGSFMVPFILLLGAAVFAFWNA